MDRFSISLKKTPPPDARTPIQKMIDGETVPFTPNDLSKILFNHNPEERKMLDATFGKMSVGIEKEEKPVINACVNGNFVTVEFIEGSSGIPQKNARYKMINNETEEI